MEARATNLRCVTKIKTLAIFSDDTFSPRVLGVAILYKLLQLSHIKRSHSLGECQVLCNRPRHSHLWKQQTKSSSSEWGINAIGHVDKIPRMQCCTGISWNIQSKSYTLSLTECVWEFWNNTPYRVMVAPCKFSNYYQQLYYLQHSI